MADILVVGSINMDLLLQTARVPEAGESFIGSRYSWVPGGKGANQAAAAAKAGGAVTFLGKLGDDANGAVLLRGLSETGIDVSKVLTAREAPTGLAVIIVEPSGENRIIVFPGANLELTPGDVTDVFGNGPAEIRGFDAVMLSFEIPVDVIEQTVTSANAAGIPLYVDAGPPRPLHPDVLKGVRLLSPNRTELAALTDLPAVTMDETRAAAAALFRRLAPEYLIVKLGAEGCLLLTSGGSGGPEQRHVPAYPVQAVDGTAAGDAFTAGLAVEHLRTGNMAEAVRFGSAAGALAASKLGARPSLPTRAEVEEFLRKRG